jgi:hypothetical protein
MSFDVRPEAFELVCCRVIGLRLDDALAID